MIYTWEDTKICIYRFDETSTSMQQNSWDFLSKSKKINKNDMNKMIAVPLPLSCGELLVPNKILASFRVQK